MFIYQDLKEKENDELDIQLKVFDENKEDDLTELSHRLNDIRAEMEYPFDKPQKSFCMYCEKRDLWVILWTVIRILVCQPNLYPFIYIRTSL